MSSTQMIGISFLYFLVIAQMPTSLQAQSAARPHDSNNRTSSQFRLLNRLRREPEATSTTTTTVSPLSSNLYENEVVVTPTSPILKSRIKKQGIFLTLDLRPQPPLLLESPRIDSFTTPPAIREPENILTTTSSIQTQKVRLTTTTVPSSSTKSIRILDRLSQLTNMKLKSASLSSQGTNYGSKNRPTIKDIIASRRNESLGGDVRNEVAYQSSRVPTIRMVRPKQTDFRTGNNKKQTETKQQEKLTKAEQEEEEEDEDNSAEDNESQETFVDGNNDAVNKTLISKVGGHIASIINKPSLPLTEAALKTPTTKSSTVSAVIVNPTTGNPIKNNEGHNDSVAYNQEESRFITADEIGGARPTQTPFHFTTPPPTLPTTTEARIVPQIQRNSNQYNKGQSPHNFIYAPTQDPIAVAHNEDGLDGEDFEHFRAAHQTFGTKVGTDATTPIAPRADRPSPKFYSVTEGPALPVRMLAKKPRILIKTTTPPPPAPPNFNPVSESSKGTNNINEQLPFYKEQGGIFEHPKYSTSQINSNEIQFSERLKQNAGVKYAPKSPAAQQSQNNLYSPNPYNNQHQHPTPQIPVQPTPAYIPAQQPLYVAPTQPAYAPQGNYNPHNNYNNPVPNYYQPVPAPPVAAVAPGYYPAPHQTPPPPPTLAAPVQHFQPPVIAPVHQYHQQPAYQPQAQPAVVYNQPQPAYVHVQPAQQQPQHHYQQPQPIPAPPVQISRSSLPGNAYYTPSLSSGPAYRHEGGRPPPRHDPDSDTYYGSPDAGPEKPQPTKSKPERRKLTRPEPSYEDSRERAKPRKDDYNRRPPPPAASRRQHDERPPPRRTPPEEDYYRPPPPPPRREPSRPPPRRNEPYDDYETDPNEQVRDVVNPAYEGVRNNEKEFDDSFDRVGQSFYKPTADDYGPAQSPNFAHPNIQYDGGRGQQQRPAPPPPRQYSEPQHDARRGPDRYRDPDYNDETTDRGLPVLDPIYTRTIKQYDDELRGKRPQQPPPPEEEEEEHPPEDDHHEEPEQPERGHSKPRGQYRDEPPPEEEEEQEEPEEEEERPPPRIQQQKQRDDEEEEEEEPEEEERPPPRRQQQQRDDEEEEEEEPEEEERPPPRRQQQQRDDEEEEEEEETQEKPQKEPPQREQEEEEEEEEEEQPRKQEKGQKKKPPKKPRGDEKAGSLDDDILGIEREFGGGFGSSGGRGGGGPVVYHPVLGRK